MSNSKLKAVLSSAKTIKTLESILDVLMWDQETMMPHGANDHRTEQKTLLAEIIHNKKQDPCYFENIIALADHFQNDTSDNAIIIKRLHEDILKAKKIPTSFITRLTTATSIAFNQWQKARHEKSWAIFAPHMETLVDLMREKADLLGYQNHPLDALLDIYEPGATVASIDTLFLPLKKKLSTIYNKIQKTSLFNQHLIQLDTSPAEQTAIATAVIDLLGYDWNYGRLDYSEHPFSTAFHPTDSRITIRSNSTDLFDQIFSALHEAGHGLYEIGLPSYFYGTPLCEAASLSIHESQSRFFETIIGQSKAFSIPLFSILEKHFGKKNPFSSPEMLYKHINNIVPIPIRTQSDEVTYPFHVIIRYEIEKELLDTRLSVKDLPDRWNNALYESLHIIPHDDTQGCLQDVHWSLGSFGYFPTYTLGSIYAICLQHALKKELSNFDTDIEHCNFTPIKTWLKENIWQHGRRYLSQELMTKILQKPIAEDMYIEYLEKKYL